MSALFVIRLITLPLAQRPVCPICKNVAICLGVEVMLPYRCFCAAIGCAPCLGKLVRSDLFHRQQGRLVLHEGRISLDDVIVTNTRSGRRAKIKKTQRRELELAAELEGRRVPASGSGMCKGDACTSRFVVDDKMTESARYSIGSDTLNLLHKLAAQTSRFAALRIGLKGGIELAVMPWRTFQEVSRE
jgi:hypothetical protein